MKSKVAFGADHGGFELKNELVQRLTEMYDIDDVGAHTFNPSDDYPDFAEAVARKVVSGETRRGVIICGSGVGACVAANKIPGIRASVCHDVYSAHQGVEHDNMNVLCLGARVVGSELAFDLITTFLQAQFTGKERHRRRLEKISAIEHNGLQKVKESNQ